MPETGSSQAFDWVALIQRGTIIGLVTVALTVLLMIMTQSGTLHLVGASVLPLEFDPEHIGETKSVSAATFFVGVQKRFFRVLGATLITWLAWLVPALLVPWSRIVSYLIYPTGDISGLLNQGFTVALIAYTVVAIGMVFLSFWPQAMIIGGRGVFGSFAASVRFVAKNIGAAFVLAVLNLAVGILVAVPASKPGITPVMGLISYLWGIYYLLWRFHLYARLTAPKEGYHAATPGDNPIA
jgi:hypothetical protein